MPRKTKEQSELKETKKDTKETVKKTTAKKAAVKPKAEKAKTATKKASTPKSKTTTTKKTATKKASTTKKTVTSKVKKENTKKESKAVKKETKTAATKKATSKKTTTAKKKTTATKKAVKTTAKKKTVAKNKKVEVVEYYDLPYRYNQTIVKLLAQTPTTLFVYWDISDSDRQNFKEKYGENFFESTKPVLIVHNETLNYSFEVEINDFANSWYLHVSDSKCDYRIELGRRPIYITEKINSDYIFVSTSNEIESPNDKILFDSIGDRVFFRDVKTGIESEKSIYNISLLRNMGKIYNIYDLYKAIYNNENVEEIYDLYNPSSGNPSSSF